MSSMLVIEGKIQKDLEKNRSMVMLRENAEIKHIQGDGHVQIDLLIQGMGLQSLFAEKGEDYFKHIRGKTIEIHIKD